MSLDSDTALETVVRTDVHTSRAVCPTCGVRFVAFGSDPSGALAMTAQSHDQECADLARAVRVLRSYDRRDQ